MLVRDIEFNEKPAYSIEIEAFTNSEKEEGSINPYGRGYSTVLAFKNSISPNSISLRMFNDNGLHATRIENEKVVDYENNPNFCDTATHKQSMAAINDFDKHLNLKANDLEIVIRAPKIIHPNASGHSRHHQGDTMAYYFAKTQVVPLERLGGQLHKSNNFILKLSSDYLFSQSMLDIILDNHPKKKNLVVSKDIDNQSRLQNLILKHSLSLETSQEDVLDQMNYGESAEILNDKLFYYKDRNAILINLSRDDVLPSELFSSR